MPVLKLSNLHCHVSDESDLDEIYLKVKDERIWPPKEKYQRVNLGETSLDLSLDNVSKGDILEIELWDYDTLSRDDKLGSFSLHLDQLGSGFRTDLKRVSGTKASYSIDWEFY